MSILPLPYSVDSNQPTGRELIRLMKVPIDSYDDALAILQLTHYPRLLETFDFNGRKILASYLVQSIVDHEACITTADDVSPCEGRGGGEGGGCVGGGVGGRAGS